MRLGPVWNWTNQGISMVSSDCSTQWIAFEESNSKMNCLSNKELLEVESWRAFCKARTSARLKSRLLHGQEKRQRKDAVLSRRTPLMPPGPGLTITDPSMFYLSTWLGGGDRPIAGFILWTLDDDFKQAGTLIKSKPVELYIWATC